MSLVRLTWQQQGIYDNFEVYRSTAPIDPGSLPSPYATGINLTTYDDTDVASDTVYYYRVGVRRFDKFLISQQVAVSTAVGGFVKNVELLFENNFIDNQGNSIWQSTTTGGSPDITFNTNSASGVYAGYFDAVGGTARALWSNTEELNFGTSNFTINLDVYRQNTDASGTYSELLNTGALTVTADEPTISFHANGKIGFEFYDGTSWKWVTENNADAQLLNYYNVKFNRVDYYVEQYINDVLVDRGYLPSTVNFNKANRVTLGNAQYDISNRFCGNIDNFYTVRGGHEPQKNRHHPDLMMPLTSNLSNLGRRARVWTTGGTSLTWETVTSKQGVSFANGYAIIADNDGIADPTGQVLTLKPFILEFDFLIKNFNTDIGYSNLLADRLSTNAGGLWVYNDQWGSNSRKVGLRWSNDANAIEVPNLLLSKTLSAMTWYTLRMVSDDMTTLKVYIADELVGEIAIGSNQFILGQLGRDNWSSVVSRAVIRNLKITTPITDVPASDYNPYLVCDMPFKDSGRTYLLREMSGRMVWSHAGLERSNFGVVSGMDCVTLNGVDEYLMIKNEPQLATCYEDFIIQFYARLPSGSASNKVLFGSSDSNNTIKYVGSNTINLTINGTGATYGGFVEGQLNKCTFQRVGTVVKVYINDTLQGQLSVGTAYINWCRGGYCYIGYTAANGYTQGSFSSLKIVKGTSDISLLIDDTTSTYEQLVTGTSPIVYYPMDNASAGTVTNLMHATDNQGSLSGSGITYRQKPLREGHAGAIGFDVAVAGTSKMNVPAGITSAFRNLPTGSHAWCCWLYQTATTTYNTLFANWGNPSMGYAEFRLMNGNYQFPENTRGINIPGYNGLNTVRFIAVIYNVENGTYRCFVNGTWTSGTFVAPGTLQYNSGTFEIPAAASYNYYGVRGYISDVAFWKYAVTESYIERLYAKGQFKPLVKAQLSAEFFYVDEDGNSFNSLSWTQGGSYESFDVLRSDTEFGTYSTIVSNTHLLTYSDHSVTLSNTYWYKIRTRRGTDTIDSDPLMCDTYSRFVLNFSEPIGTPDPHDVVLNFNRKL